MVGKDRQEGKLRKQKKAAPDRDQALHYPGSAVLEGPAEARQRNNQK